MKEGKQHSGKGLPTIHRERLVTGWDKWVEKGENKRRENDGNTG